MSVTKDPAYVHLDACRACGGSRLHPILDLGSTPLANALRAPAERDLPELKVPLRLVFCPGCTLIQIDETVNPDVLFRNYFYRSSFSESFLKHAQQISERLVKERQLRPDSLVAEVASNDGYLLQYYCKAGIPVLGIEPASNIARIATEERGVRTINEFFSRALAQQLVAQGLRADIIHANNVLAHVADLNGFVSGLRTLVKDDGVVVSESPYAVDFIAHSEFDTIYHEHLCYYSLTALDHLFSAHGLTIVDAEHLDIHGGSVRIFASPQRADRVRSASVQRMLAAEAVLGVSRIDYYRNFSTLVETIKRDLVATIARLRAEGRRIAAYGAAAKGATLLNYAGIDHASIEFVADRSPLKQGKLMPGVGIPIVSPDEIMRSKPDYVVILAWNFADEIMRQLDAYARSGGRFIIPIPTVTIR